MRRSKSTPDLYSSFIAEAALGEIRPGERLSEERLAARWKVGRVPVRETLLRLEHDGLIVRQPNSGTYLRKLDLPEISECYDIRILIEPMVTEIVARVASDEQLEALVRLAEVADKLGDEPHQMGARDRQFHSRLCELSQLRLAPRIVNVARLHLRCSTLHQRISILGTYTISQPDHQPIAAALRVRDGEKAAALMREHLRAAKAAVLKDLERIKVQMESARLHARGEPTSIQSS